MANNSRLPGARYPSDHVAAAGRPSRATRAPRRRPGDVVWPAAIIGVPAPYERMMFEELKVGLSAAAGQLDAVHLAEACRNLALVHAARERLQLEGLTVKGENGTAPHPLVRVIGTLGGLAHRQLQALGLLTLLLDRAAVGEGLGDRLAAGDVDEHGCALDALGRRVYVGTPKASAKIVKLREKRKAAK